MFLIDYFRLMNLYNILKMNLYMIKKTVFIMFMNDSFFIYFEILKFNSSNY
jgi:hypothetical protein